LALLETDGVAMEGGLEKGYEQRILRLWRACDLEKLVRREGEEQGAGN
jgi:hypothetical protein